MSNSILSQNKSPKTHVTVHSLLCHSNSTKIMSQLSAVLLWHNPWQTRYFSPLNDHCFHIQRVNEASRCLSLPHLYKSQTELFSHRPWLWRQSKRQRERGRKRDDSRDREEECERGCLCSLSNSFSENALDGSNNSTEGSLKSMVFSHLSLCLLVFSSLFLINIENLPCFLLLFPP